MKNVINARFQPLNDARIVESCMDAVAVSDILGYDVIAYRIRWHKHKNFEWSIWFVPGINDHYKKEGEPIRRYIACFNDHEFEIIGSRILNKNRRNHGTQ